MRYLIGCLLLASVGCGSSGPNISPTPTPAPAPQPAPAPSFPNMIAGWSGAMTSTGVIVQTGERGAVVCNQTWIVNAQTADAFSGTFQSSGGSCAQAGTVTGRVSSTGAVSALAFSVTVGASADCTRTSGSQVFAGIATTTSLTAQAADRLHCTANGITGDIDRSMTLSMTRR